MSDIERELRMMMVMVAVVELLVTVLNRWAEHDRSRGKVVLLTANGLGDRPL